MSLVFEGTVSTQGNRYIIIIPKEKHDIAKKLHGKKVVVIVYEL